MRPANSRKTNFQLKPLEGRIAALCDVYDALVSERPYKHAWSSEEALAHLKSQAGSHFDPRLVEAFIGIRDRIEAIQRELSDEPVQGPDVGVLQAA